jgi:hypothetical protein
VTHGMVGTKNGDCCSGSRRCPRDALRTSGETRGLCAWREHFIKDDTHGKHSAGPITDGYTKHSERVAVDRSPFGRTVSAFQSEQDEASDRLPYTRIVVR